MSFDPTTPNERTYMGKYGAKIIAPKTRLNNTTQKRVCVCERG